MTLPFPRLDQAARMAVFDKEVKEAHRRGVLGVPQMRRNIGRHMAYHAADIQANWARRNKPLHLRSLDWMTPSPGRPDLGYGPEKVAQVAAQWDGYDREQNVKDRAQARAACRLAIAMWRWSKWMLATMEQPDVLAELAEGPSYEYLHWAEPIYRAGLHEMDFKEPTILDNKGRVIAEVIQVPNDHKGPTMKAVIYDLPFLRTQPPLTYCLLRTRKAAVAWIVKELHKRAYHLFGNDIDLPERGDGK